VAGEQGDVGGGGLDRQRLDRQVVGQRQAGGGRAVDRNLAEVAQQRQVGQVDRGAVVEVELLDGERVIETGHDGGDRTVAHLVDLEVRRLGVGADAVGRPQIPRVRIVAVVVAGTQGGNHLPEHGGDRLGHVADRPDDVAAVLDELAGRAVWARIEVDGAHVAVQV